MQFISFLILAMLCFRGSAIGQEEENEKWDVPRSYMLGSNDDPFVPGIIFGGNTANMANDNFGGFHNLTYTAGATVYARLAPKFWVGPELLFVKRGVTGVRMTESYYWGTYMEKYYLKMNTAEMPILFHLFGMGKNWNHVYFGASYWRIINSKESLLTSPVTIYPDQSVYYFNKNNFDFVVGGAIHLGEMLYLNVRYQRSLTPVRGFGQVHPYVGAGNQYMTHCSVQLMYLFRKNDLQ